MKKILFIFIISLISCNNDLDIANPNELTNESFWQNETDAIKGINSSYSTFHRGGFSRWQPMLYDLRSDIGASFSPWSELANALNNFIQPNSNFGPTNDVYFDNYVGVFRANQVLANVPNIEMDTDLKKRIVAEAHFFRGMHYYHLASLWGNVVLQLEPSKPTDINPTSPEADVWQQVISDLSLAVIDLPTTYSANELGRITKGGASALLAKAYMQIGDFEKAKLAMDYFFIGEGSGIYDLTTDYADNFKIFTEFNVESVLEWSYANNPLEFTDNDTQTPNHNFGTSIAQFYGPPGIGYTDAEALRWVTEEFEIEKTVTNKRDPRLAATYLYDFTDERGPDFSMIYGLTFKERYGSDNKRVFFRKFLNDHHSNSEGFRSENNYRFIRFSDVLLMYAECLNEIGKTSEAYSFVDRVRERAGLAPLSLSKPNLNKQAFLNQIKHERLLELTGEGHRFNDLKRWGDLNTSLSVKDPAFSNFIIGKHELLPIPQNDLDINPNMVQNPGW